MKWKWSHDVKLLHLVPETSISAPGLVWSSLQQLQPNTPESSCWRAPSCPIPSAGTLTSVLWSGSPSSWCTESPSASAGSAPRLTATCSAPFQGEWNSTALIFVAKHQMKTSSAISCSAGLPAPTCLGTNQHDDLQTDCLLTLCAEMGFKWISQEH